jgi:hypothetical protein
VKCEFIFDFDTDDPLKRIEKNEKMRRTGQNPRRTGQRGGNPAELTTERLKKVWTEFTELTEL